MLAQKIELELEHFNLPAITNELIQDCKSAGDEICARSGSRSIPDFEPADGRIGWNILNSVRQQLLTDSDKDSNKNQKNPVFCELGSGIGLITLLAASTGMAASGIEIEEELVDLACGFSEQYAIPASFYNASIYPKDNSVSSIDYGAVDLFFAYPWPNQISRVVALFDQVAASGALLVCYHGGQNYRLLKHP